MWLWQMPMNFNSINLYHVKLVLNEKYGHCSNHIDFRNYIYDLAIEISDQFHWLIKFIFQRNDAGRLLLFDDRHVDLLIHTEPWPYIGCLRDIVPIGVNQLLYKSDKRASIA